MIRSTMPEDRAHPTVTHTPVIHIGPQQPLVVTANISDPSGIKWARVRYRNLRQYHDFRTIEMTPTDQPDVYQAVIPVEQMDLDFDVMYYIAVMNHTENGVIYPDLLQETPYVIVHLDRQNE